MSNPSPERLREALEQALIDNPEDRATYAAYADLLTEQGDPQGEFIQVQLALEDQGQPALERKRLQEREQELLQEHQRTWLGEELASYLIDNRTDDLPSYFARSYERGKYRFARGWLAHLEINYLSADLARVLAASPSVRLLRSLSVASAEDYPARACLALLAQTSNLRNVRFFTLGENEDQSTTDGEGVEKLIGICPRIEEIFLLAQGEYTGAVFGLANLTQLRKLQVYHARSYPLEVLAGNPALGRLTHLRLKPHALEPDDEEAYISLEGVRALVHSLHLKSLTHLELQLSDLGDAGCAEIVGSGILQRLKVLDLSHGRITDEGARILAGCPDLPKLELLNLDVNCLTPAGAEALRTAGVRYRAEQQWALSGDPFTDSEYLTEGDWE